MANIKWSGIESWKYGLTARWYVSAYYGNDVDVDAVGYYDPSTNPTGHGGPTRPFATLSKIYQDATIATNSVVILDSGYYTYTLTTLKIIIFIGDGTVNYSNSNGAASVAGSSALYNITALSSSLVNCSIIDGNAVYCTGAYLGVLSGVHNTRNTKIIESTWGNSGIRSGGADNCTFIRSTFFYDKQLRNILIINCPDATIASVTPRPVGGIKDYSVIIGTVKSNRAINGKTTGVTIEDFKIDGQYFVKSFSEVDLFGNASGSGASVAQLQTLFNNYFSPIYLDTWMFADLSLKPTAHNIMKFGGLNGTYIGALPVGYHFSSQTLWDNRNQTNTVDLELDSIYNYLQITGNAEFGTYESNEFDLGAPVIIDPVNFFANLVYNANGTVKQGVANQRIDTDPDSAPDNTLNQRVVYSYELAYSPNGVDALSTFKPFELNRKPTIDNSGDTQLDDNFVASEQTFITVQRFIIKFVLRKVVIA